MNPSFFRGDRDYLPDIGAIAYDGTESASATSAERKVGDRRWNGGGQSAAPASIRTGAATSPPAA